MESWNWTIIFQDHTIHTAVYLKMDAHDSLLSEGVCRQLGIISYYPSINVSEPARPLTSARVTAVSVKLLQSTRLPPQQTTMVSVQVDGEYDRLKPLLVESDSSFSCDHGEELQFGDSLVSVSSEGCAMVPLTNPTGFTVSLEKGVVIGTAAEADCVSDECIPLTNSRVECDEQLTEEQVV